MSDTIKVGLASPLRVPRQRQDPDAAVKNASAATRHLSAAAYLDDEFRRTCLAEIYHQRRRLVAPSYGYDVVTVMHHCLVAQRIATARDSTILAVGLVTLLYSPIAFGLALVTLVAAAAAPILLRRTGAQVRAARQRGLHEAVRFVGRRILLAVVAGAAVLAVLVPAVERARPSSADITIVIALSAAAVLYGAPVLANLSAQIMLSRLRRRAHSPVIPRQRRLRDIARLSSGNVVAYDGSRPFVGAGVQLENSSIPVRLIQKDQDLSGATEERREFDVPPFRAIDLIDYVRARLETLVSSEHPGQSVLGLTVDDCIFLAGEEGPLLTYNMDEPRVQSTIESPNGAARHFLVCQVNAWDGELVTTLYLHMALQGRTLVVQLSGWALAPCDPKYRAPGRRRESHPPPPTDPYVTVSRHTARVALTVRR